MLLPQNQYNIDNQDEFLIERPIGWSSACLDSTIDYYLSCNYSDLQESEDLESNNTNSN